MLVGTLVNLRQPLDADTEFLVAIRNDPELQQQLMAAARPNTPARVRQWLDGRLNDKRTLFFIIAEGASNKAIGYIQLREMDPIHGHAELGICLAASARGTGAAAEAMRLISAYADDTFRVQKIVLRVLCSNARAIAFYEKVGFRRVGVLEQHYYHQREFHDVMVMEKLLKKETP
ncbi:MAG: GNAT family protein [Planctomycetota bacterium]